MFRRILLTLICSALAWAQSDKVSATVRKLAAGKESVSVFVLGAYQPQEEIAGQWKEVLGNNVDAEERAFDRLANQPFAVESAVERAKARRDDAITGMRKEIARQVQREIQPSQDRLTSLLTRSGASNLRPFHVVNMIAADVPVGALDHLQAPVTLVARLLRLVASDDTGLQGQLDVRVVPP